MRLLPANEVTVAMKYFDLAQEISLQSICSRAHCGAVIVKNGLVIGSGFNSPPQNDPAYSTCLNEYDIPAGFRHDRTCCIHAEQRAIEDAVKNAKAEEMKGATIYFIRTDENKQKIKATDLVCTICSRAVLDAWILEFALYCEEGIKIYDTVEFNELSYKYKTPRKNLSN